MDRFADNLRVVAGLAESLIVLGRTEAAEAELETALLQFPDRPRLLALAARCAAARGAWVQADQRWSGLLARSPDQPDGLIGRAEALFQLGQGEAAEALLREPAERFP
jgi:predicted Zn-dependent protease